jgi:hypothetical protein
MKMLFFFFFLLSIFSATGSPATVKEKNRLRGKKTEDLSIRVLADMFGDLRFF